MLKKNKKGQIMILSVLLMSAAVLGATTLASMLVLFQLKKSAGAEDSARAIFAADAGIEEALYTIFKDEGCPEEIADKSFGYLVKTSSGCSQITSVGNSNQAYRSFNMVISGLCDFGGQLNPDFCKEPSDPEPEPEPEPEPGP